MEQPPAIPETTPEPQTRMSLGARLMNIFAIPGEVFDEVRQSALTPANWLVPALILTLVGCIGASWVQQQPAIQQQMRDMREKPLQKMVENGKISQEIADKQMEAGETAGKIGFYVVVAATAFITPFFWGVIVWLVGSKVFHGNFEVLKGVEVVGLAGMIDVLNSILTTLLIISTGSLFASPSAGLLIKDFDPQQNAAHGILALLNPITLWALVLYGIGLARIARVPFVRAAAWVFGIWIGYKLVFVGIGVAVRAILRKAGMA